MDIAERVYEWPIRGWPEAEKAKDIGKMTKINLMKGLESLSRLLLTHELGWTREQVETLKREVRQDVNDRKKQFHHIVSKDVWNHNVTYISTWY